MAAFFWIPKEEKKYSVEQIEEVSKQAGGTKTAWIHSLRVEQFLTVIDL